jgi:hypothetical protein
MTKWSFLNKYNNVESSGFTTTISKSFCVGILKSSLLLLVIVHSILEISGEKMSAIATYEEVKGLLSIAK